jgi:hypothetical protein
LLLTGNERNNEGKYLQYKNYAWTGSSMEAMGENNGQIAVSRSASTIACVDMHKV